MTEIAHNLQTADVISSMPSQIAVAGNTDSGIPMYKSIQNNSWMERVYDPICLTGLLWTTAQDNGSMIMNSPISVIASGGLPFYTWLTYLLSQYHGYSFEYKLTFQFVSHPAHRGSVAVHMTTRNPTAPHVKNQYLPTEIMDISGGPKTFTVDGPSLMVLNSKIHNDSYRNPQSLYSFDESIPRLATSLHFLTISVNAPLIASNLLPTTVPLFVTLTVVPGTLKLFHRSYPRDTVMDPALNSGYDFN